MDSFKAVCPHRSIPVETDDSMTESSLDLVWPSCQSCQGQGEEPSGSLPDPRLPRPEALRGRPDPGGRPVRLGPEPPFHRRPATYLEVTESCRPADNWSQAWAGAPDWDPAHHRYHDGGRQGSWNVPQENSVEEMESLETPLPLMSDFNNIPCSPAQHPANTPRQAPALGTCVPPCRRRPPVDEARHGNCSHHRQSLDPHGRHRQRQPPSWNPAPPDRLPPLEAARTPAVIPPPRAATPGGLMGEVSVETSQGTAPRPRSGETRRTVSLPEECRNIPLGSLVYPLWGSGSAGNVFITYSVDTAQEMIPFTKFLTGQGFKAAIDIFDNPVRRMDITKWMDSFLKDKSVLIIVVISPRYKEDVDGDREDEHGLHTKYIHNQIQNEFIQQRCLNFRLVPVLFPAASKKHVPSWLQSTRLYRWPQDTQDLLLRLLREERYVTPPLGRGLTLTVRPL